MRNILFLISLSRHELFLSEYKLLYSKYTDIIERYGLPIKIMGYMGGESDFIDHDSNILHLNIDDTDISSKYFGAHKCIIDNPWIIKDYDYDIIVTTNTSTVMNLRLLNIMVQDERFDMSGIYGNIIKTLWEPYTYPEGKIMIYSKDVRNKIIKNWNEYSFPKTINSQNCADYIWSRTEDSHIGRCCQYMGIEMHDIPHELKFSIRKHGLCTTLDDINEIESLSNTLCMILKTADYSPSSSFEYNKMMNMIRLSTENLFIQLGCMIYNYRLTHDNINGFLSKIYE